MWVTVDKVLHKNLKHFEKWHVTLNPRIDARCVSRVCPVYNDKAITCCERDITTGGRRAQESRKDRSLEIERMEQTKTGKKDQVYVWTANKIEQHLVSSSSRPLRTMLLFRFLDNALLASKFLNLWLLK